MIFDTHIHTELSTDSEMPIRQVIQAIDELQIGAIITEHYDHDNPTEGFKCDSELFFNTYQKYRSEKLLLGIEMGMTTKSVEPNEKLMASHPFDFVLGSIHMIEDLDIFLEYSKLEIDEKTFYDRYYIYMIECIQKYNNFDSLGHIDYIYRYAPFPNTEINLIEHRELIEQVFKELIAKEKAIEINTRRLDNSLSKQVLFELYKLYYQLGGRFVTLGSDGHTKAAIGKHFKEAEQICDTIGLKPVYFKERKMIYCK